MKIVKIFSVVVAAASALCALSSFSQTAALNVGGVPVATCTYDSGSFSNAAGTLTINCVTSVNYTGGGGGGGTGPYALTLAALPSAGGTFACTNSGGACVSTYAAGTAVPVTAIPATGYTFQNWATGPCTGSTTSLCTVTMNAAVTMTANFQSSTSNPPPPGVILGTALPPICASAAGSTFTGTGGQVYAWPLTKTTTGKGSVQATAAAGANNSYSVEMWLSKVPGDYATAQAMPVTYTLFGTVKIKYPYYGVFGAESASLSWVPITDNQGTSIVPTTENWYFNMRFSTTSTVTLQVTSPTCT